MKNKLCAKQGDGTLGSVYLGQRDGKRRQKSNVRTELQVEQ